MFINHGYVWELQMEMMGWKQALVQAVQNHLQWTQSLDR